MLGREHWENLRPLGPSSGRVTARMKRLKLTRPTDRRRATARPTNRPSRAAFPSSLPVSQAARASAAAISAEKVPPVVVFICIRARVPMRIKSGLHGGGIMQKTMAGTAFLRLPFGIAGHDACHASDRSDPMRAMCRGHQELSGVPRIICSRARFETHDRLTCHMPGYDHLDAGEEEHGARPSSTPGGSRQHRGCFSH